MDYDLDWGFSLQLVDNGFIFVCHIMLYIKTDYIEGNGLFQIHSEVPSELASPKSPEMLSNLSNGERCAIISRILMKKDIAESLLDIFNDATVGHALDEDDCIKLKALEHDLINALREFVFDTQILMGRLRGLCSQWCHVLMSSLVAMSSDEHTCELINLSIFRGGTAEEISNIEGELIQFDDMIKYDAADVKKGKNLSEVNGIVFIYATHLSEFSCID
ncbi:hypothetical protein CDAR_114261 [Caerostris darwini]|uniref:Uncharacterized protein n=1 Tax=Caerostris darwini TaxID=1538125 RepID=A0AAV4M8B7_9ARAC|nr:hypothetical protein CDAR_114261 [Caerostris darwini]